MADTNDVILIGHPVHADIGEDEMRAAIPSSWTVRAVVEILPARLTLEETRGADWHALARAQANQWRANVAPLLTKYSQARIVYFGLAPIPLALHLGSVAERWTPSTVFLRNHSTRQWQYAGGEAQEVRGPDGPNESTRSAEPAIIAVSTTVLADIDAARSLLGATSAEIEIRTEILGEDVLGTEQAVGNVAERFRRALELLEGNRPNVSEIHLFCAIPVGLAFLLGTYITPTRHARIVAYQYHRSSEPRLVEALRLPIRDAPAVPLTEEERSKAGALREAWENARQGLTVFVCRPQAGEIGPKIIGELGAPFRVGAFAKLESAEQTPILSSIDLVATDVEDGFRFDSASRQWLLGDTLLSAVRRTLAEESLPRAGRMLLLHEALHHGKQGLTAETSTQIRLAPKVLEELDYLADIWAMMHEFAFNQLLEAPWEEQREALLGILTDAISTMWAFDADREHGSLEVRRVNRYLIWYANLARLERVTTLKDAITLLAIKPVVELVGPEVAIRDGRIVAYLNRPSVRPTELCFLDQQGRLRRYGDTNAASVSGLAMALGDHDGDRVRAAMRGFLSQET